MIFAPVCNVRVIMEAFIGSPSLPIVSEPRNIPGVVTTTELSLSLYWSALNRVVAIIIIC